MSDRTCVTEIGAAGTLSVQRPTETDWFPDAFKTCGKSRLGAKHKNLEFAPPGWTSVQ